MAPNGVYHDAPVRGRQIPASVLATSPVALYRNPRELPLDLIQRIITFVEDVADIARVTRTSRLFYYMALPRLYERMTLKSYPELRYVDGEPEGYGGGSPFSMALLGLVTRNVAGYVKHWKVTGEWRERDVEEFLKGRIPDNSMMLTISIRAAMDRMALLESFWWDMNAKPMSTLYAGLTVRSTLTSLRIKSPMQRTIRPTTTVPPISSLKELWLSDIDPLCYPDDFSVMLLQSKKLEKLNLHWSPRMREQGEPSISLHSFVGRCVAAGYRMNIQELGLMNMYSPNQGELTQALNEDRLERVAFINCVDTKNPRTVFFDQTWSKPNNPKVPKNIKIMRGEGLDRGHVDMLSKLKGMEEFYIISRSDHDRRKSSVNGNLTSNGVSPAESSAESPAMTPRTPTEYISLAADYLATLTQHHGHSLKILLLSDVWQLSESTAINVVKSCPNLEQFGFALGDSNLTILRKIMPYGPKIKLLRCLHPKAAEVWEPEDDKVHLFGLALEFRKSVYSNLRYLGLGLRGFALGPIADDPYVDEKNGMHGPKRRVITPLTAERLKDFKIWRMDSMELL